MSNNVLIVSREISRRCRVAADLARSHSTLWEACSALEAMSFLEHSNVDVIIADVDLPDLDCEVFLTFVGHSYPDIRRIGMTGPLEVIRTISALSEGAMENYIMHPWDPSQLQQLVSDESISDRRHDPIEELVMKLKRHVRHTTRAFGALPEAACGTTVLAHRDRVEALAALYVETIRERAPRKVNLCERVGDLVGRIGRALGLHPSRVERLRVASTVHRLGELALCTEIVDRCFLDMSMDDLATYRAYPKITARFFEEECSDVDLIAILGLHRDFYLDQKLSAEDYHAHNLLDAQILCAATEYEELMLMKDRAEPDVIRRFMAGSRGLRYNPDVIRKMFEIVPY